jgi:hypothetical protein
MKANDKTRITAVEMRFMRTTAKYNWSDYKGNYDILKELKTEPVMGKILKYKNNWTEHVNIMQTDRFPKTSKKLQTAGKKKLKTTNEETLGRRSRNGSMNGLTP